MPLTPNIWLAEGPLGGCYFLKHQKQNKNKTNTVKRLFVVEVAKTKQENENAKDITFQASKGWIESFKKGTLCPTRPRWLVILPQHFVTHPMLPELTRAGLSTDALPWLRKLIYCTEKCVFHDILCCFSLTSFLYL